MANPKGGQAPAGNNTPANNTAAETKYPRKITLKDCEAQPSNEERAAMLTNPALKIPLLKVYGIAGAAKPGMSKLPNGDVSPFVKFIGSFKAVNLKTGEIFVASAMILPRFIEEQLHGALTVPGAQGVDFAFEIGCQGDQPGQKKSAVGYTYTAKPLLAVAENSALAALEAKIGGGNVKQLNAPGK